ncbi:conjugal transfer protein TraG N-terminal domain-containing protein, partial [Burkholderia savannae]|uniref:conjugal transfer protein TraG N-terminal domain-containing protein n=1 Tax=Burkholderia savannae TaxID=1637837 RepID=UPI000A57E991
MITIELQTYWNVETLYYMFNGVASVMAGSGFTGMVKYVFIVSIALGMFAYFGKQLEMAKWFIHAFVFVSILNMPIARVAITDRTGLEPPRVVDHVPFALAAVAQANNLVFGSLTRWYETVFNVPDDLGLQSGDVAFGHRILKQVNSAIVREPGLRADLIQFIKECTLYDVKDGVITPQQLVGATDTWNTIFNNTSPARFVTYNTLTATPTTDVCTNVANVLKQRVNDAVTAGQRFYGKQAFTRANSDAIATGMFINAVGTSYDWILNNSSNASDAMKQAMFNNIWKEAGTELPALLNDPARVSEVSALAAAAQAAKQADGSNSALSLLGQETLPHMRNWIEAITYAIFPIVVILMIAVSTEGAKKIFAGYLMTMAWIGMWPVLFAVINHLSLLHLRYKARALELSAGVPFQLSDAFDATLSNEQAVIGYMVVLVPFIAAGIIKLGQGGFMTVSDRMFSGFASAGGSIGGAMENGDVGMGRTSMDTASVNSTSMNRYDSSVRLSGGGAVIGRGDGSIATMSSNGAVALSQLQNRMLTQMGVDQRFESSRNQEAHRTDITSSGDQMASRHSTSSSLSDVVGHDSTRGSYQQNGVNVSTTESGSHGGQYGRGESVGQSTRESSNFNTQTGAHDSVGMNLGVGRGRGGGGGGGGGGADPKEERRIVDAMKQSGASQQEIDHAVKNYRGSRGGGGAGGAAGAGGSVVSGGFGADSRKNYSASHNRNRDVTSQHGTDESARVQDSYNITGSRSAQGSAGQQSNQTDRHATEASYSNVDESSRVRDVSDRREYGTGDRFSRGESNSFSTHRDLMADPYLFEKVAARNGMTAMRFANQAEDRIMDMVQDYISEKGMVQQAQAMPQQTFAGEKLPTTKAELKHISDEERSELPSDAGAAHSKKIAQTGFGGTAPINVDTRAPGLIGAARGSVDAQLDPSRKGSMSERTSALDENVRAWASPDKALGEGRANPMNVVENMEGRDVKDYARKVVDKVTGGDGTADGEKLTDNMRRETAAEIPINRPGGKK